MPPKIFFFYEFKIIQCKVEWINVCGAKLVPKIPIWILVVARCLNFASYVTNQYSLDQTQISFTIHLFH